MSVIGFDIGNESCVIAAAKRGGIDVLLNDESKRETPAVVSFGEKQRFLGSAGAASASANPKSTISQVKRLIGKLYKEPSVQKDLKLLPFSTSEGPRGGILIELQYLKQKWTFTPVEILGMLFTHLKQIAEKNLDQSSVVDCVIGIPSYFTDLQRREYLDAARIAGLSPLRLIHDCTATALGYGMYKTDFPDSGPTNVIFVDIGHCDTQVTVAAFEEGKMKILSHSFDQNLGGRDFDEVLFKHFVAQFEKQYKIDICSNDRACIRLRAACEKVKKVLSANAEAPISIECLIDDTDVRGIITREEFEKLSSELLERVKIPCIKAVKESCLNYDEIYTIEVVGSGSRIPAIMNTLSLVFKKKPTRTLNASECVARGCALHCAMLSPTLKVQEYQVEDIFPYSIAAGSGTKNEQGNEMYQKGKLFPSNYVFACDAKTPLTVHFFYTNKTDIPAGLSPKVGHFIIGSAAKKMKLAFKVKLNDNGVVEIESALSSEDKHDRMLKFLHGKDANSHAANIPFTGNLDVATTKDEVREAREKEKKLAEQDIKVEQIKDQRNTLESFVYDTRSKLSNVYKRFATDLEKELITNSLQKTEDWLYEEDSDDEFEQDYTGKLQDLKKLLDPVEVKYKNDKEDKAREEAIKALQTCIEEYRWAVDSMAPRFRKEIKMEISKADKWLSYVSQHLLSPNDGDPVMSSSVFKDKMEAFQRRCENIKTSKSSITGHDNLKQGGQIMNPHQGGQFMYQNQMDHLNQGDQPVNLNQGDQPVNLNQGDQSMNLNQGDQSMNLNHGQHPVNTNQRNQPLNMNQVQRDQSLNVNQRDQPLNVNQRDLRVKANQRNQPLNVKPKGPNCERGPKGPN